MISTTEIHIGNQLLSVFKAYGLSPREVGAEVQLSTTLGDGSSESGSDAVSLLIATKKLEGRDMGGREAVNAKIRALESDFKGACGSFNHKGIQEAHGGYSFRCRAGLDDVLKGLDRMIAAKALGYSL